jgi:hypothetical protein
MNLLNRTMPAALALALLAGACSSAGGPTSTTTTAANEFTSTTAAATTTSTSSTTTTVQETTTSIAAHTPSTDAWGTWALILASIETGEPGAKDRANEIAAGVEGASVLYSGDFPSLNPDYWVVYWGEFESGSEASAWCSIQPDELTCYPRYLGADVSPLAVDDHAMMIDGEALVIVDVTTGERLKEFDPDFSGDGMWVGRMSLTPDAQALYYDVGWEDSWYWCDTSQGQVERFSLEFGTISTVGLGFSPAVSSDGQWLAVLIAEQCLPDPEEPDLWVITPTDTVVLYSLASGWPEEKRRWRVESVPASFDDPTMITWVDWRADSRALVVMNNAGNLYQIPLDHQGPLDAGPPVVEAINGFTQALIGNTLYVTRDETPEEWGGFDILAVDLTTGREGEVITQTVGWPLVAADTTRTRLIWGSDTQIGTAESMFGLETYLGGLAW